MFGTSGFSKNQFVDIINGIRLTIKREDAIHPQVSGNKFRKLQYNFLYLQQHSFEQVLTFGGAFSNHLAAVAAAGAHYGIPTLGLVRGEEWEAKVAKSPSLHFCRSKGMKLYFLTRAEYKEKRIPLALESSKQYVLPEGGTNALAVKGCSEIIGTTEKEFDSICWCVGTGGTLAGLIEGSSSQQQILGFPVLKHSNLETDIRQWTDRENWELVRGYECGGYAKATNELVGFMNTFYKQYGIPLDPIYTGKMLFGIFDLIKKDQWQWGTNVLIIHSGGLQGLTGFNQRNQQKGLLLLNYSCV